MKKYKTTFKVIEAEQDTVGNFIAYENGNKIVYTPSDFITKYEDYDDLPKVFCNKNLDTIYDSVNKIKKLTECFFNSCDYAYFIENYNKIIDSLDNLNK